MAEPQRRIDHVVLAVRDLDQAARFYEALGFQVGARNRHPWGTENRIIQFASAFIELITVAPDEPTIPEHAPRQFSFGAAVRDYLRRREGLAMVVLDSEDAIADAAAFEQAGIGAFDPFHFEREGRKPDGSAMRVAFSLAFAEADCTRGTTFFVCQQHVPENFWNPAFQRHDNGAAGIAAITLRSPAPEACAEFLARFAGSGPDASAEGSISVPLREGGRFDVAASATAGAELTGTAITVRTADLDPFRERLANGGISFADDGNALVINPQSTFGVELRFV